MNTNVAEYTWRNSSDRNSRPSQLDGLRSATEGVSIAPCFSRLFWLTAWTIANVLAAAAFLHLSSWSWLEPNLRGESIARGSDSVVWTLTAFPVLAVVAVANIVWLLFVSRERRAQNEPWPLATITVATTICASALIVNGLRWVGF